MHPTVLTALHTNWPAISWLYFWLRPQQAPSTLEYQRIRDCTLRWERPKHTVETSSPVLTPGPYLAFSNIQDSNLVSVIGWDLVKELH